MEQVILAIHVFVAISVIVLVLLQQGKGAEVGASFGGASQTVFGSKGSGNFLTRATALLITLFFITSLTLGTIIAHRVSPHKVEKLLDAAPLPENDIPKVPD